jgi:hypothetical protein
MTETKLEIKSQFKDNLEELYLHWWSNSVVDHCEEMPEDDQLKWFLSEVEITTKKIMEEMRLEKEDH